MGRARPAEPRSAPPVRQYWMDEETRKWTVVLSETGQVLARLKDESEIWRTFEPGVALWVPHACASVVEG